MLDFSLIAVGALAGLSSGLTGVGSGALATPLSLLLGFSPSLSIAASLWMAFLTKLAATMVDRRSSSHPPDWLAARLLWIGAIPACALGSAWVWLGTAPAQSRSLTLSIAAMTLFCSLLLWASPWLAGSLSRSRHRWLGSSPSGFLLGGSIGLMLSLTSIGAGSLGSLALLATRPELASRPHRLVATSLLLSLPITLIPAIAFWALGLLNFSMLGSLLLGSIPCALLGRRLSGLFSSQALRLSVSLFLALAAIKTLIG